MTAILGNSIDAVDMLKQSKIYKYTTNFCQVEISKTSDITVNQILLKMQEVFLFIIRLICDYNHSGMWQEGKFGYIKK